MRTAGRTLQEARHIVFDTQGHAAGGWGAGRDWTRRPSGLTREVPMRRWCCYFHIVYRLEIILTRSHALTPGISIIANGRLLAM